MLMRIMRTVVASLTAVTVLVFFAVFITAKVKTDKTMPYISAGDGVLELSVKDGPEKLLEGVKATDGKDGDISKDVFVESISKFIKKGYCKVSYAVSDSDNHVVTATRQIHYTDYTSPKFTMSRPLIFSIYDGIDVLGIVGAKDCIDGDISQNVIIYSPDYQEAVEGKYTIQATVMNSKGDSSKINLPMLVEKQSKDGPRIILSNYLIYMKKGAAQDWKKYIKEKLDSTGIADPTLGVEIKTDFVPNSAGIYTVNYYAKDTLGRTCHTALMVVAE